MELQHRRVGVDAGPAARPLSYDGPGRLVLPEARGIPPEDRVGRAPRERPGGAIGQGEGGVPRVVSPWDQVSSTPCPTILASYIRAQVEGHSEAVPTRRLEAVDDLESPKSARESH